MATLSSALNIAAGSLQTTQSTLGVVSHNIANANTSGFVRQEVITSNVSLGGSSSGVTIDTVRRVVDQLAVADLNEKRSGVGYANTINTYLNNIESIFGTPGASSSPEKLINNFFNDLSELSNSPDSNALRINVIKDAEFVVDTLATISSQLNTTALSADEQVNNEIVAINEALENIYTLNGQIKSLSISESASQNANDLIDERQRQIDVLSERLNIDVINEDNNGVRIVTEDGRNLLGGGYVQLERIPSATGGIYQDIGVRSVRSNGSLSNNVLRLQTENQTGGSLKALVDIRDTEIANLTAEIEELATQFRDIVNNIHSQGTGVPPQNTLTTGNGFKLSGAAADITAELGINAGDSFEISIVDIATGQPIATTATTTVTPPTPGGSGPIVIAAGETLGSLAASIQGNADIGGMLTATTTVDANGNPQIQVSANNPNYAVVMKNNTGNVLGEIGINNFFQGETLADLEVKPEIVSNPTLIATARMRESDGGVSFVDNRNATALAQLGDQEIAFNAAGNMSAKSDTLTGYFNGVSSNLAVNIQDSSNRLDFQQTLFDDVQQRVSNSGGVNMDEELSNLILFQRTYQASARIISVIDEMLNTLVNSV